MGTTRAGILLIKTAARCWGPRRAGVPERFFFGSSPHSLKTLLARGLPSLAEVENEASVFSGCARGPAVTLIEERGAS